MITQDDKVKNKMIGICYLTNKDADVIKENLVSMNASSRYDNCYWEESLVDHENLFQQQKFFLLLMFMKSTLMSSFENWIPNPII